MEPRRSLARLRGSAKTTRTSDNAISWKGRRIRRQTWGQEHSTVDFSHPRASHCSGHSRKLNPGLIFRDIKAHKTVLDSSFMHGRVNPKPVLLALYLLD